MSLSITWLTLVQLSFSLVFIILSVGVLIVKPHTLHSIQRTGLAIMTSGALMRIGMTLSPDSPFDQWTIILLRIGMVWLVCGYILDKHLFISDRNGYWIRINTTRPRETGSSNS